MLKEMIYCGLCDEGATVRCITCNAPLCVPHAAAVACASSL
jgi:hypothetical protein